MKYILALFLIQTLWFCQTRENVDKIDTKSTEQYCFSDGQKELLNLKTDTIQYREISTYLKLNGILHVPPQNLVSVTLPFGGYLRQSELIEGMKVRKGEVIAYVEHPDFIKLQQEYLEMKALLEFNELEFQRQVELDQKNVAAKRDYQKAKSELETLKSRFWAIQAHLRMLNIQFDKLNAGQLQSKLPILSPVNGYVTKVNSNIGAYSSPSDQLFEIADTEHLHVELYAYEKDLTHLKVGQEISFTLSTDSSVRKAEIFMISKSLNQDGTITVHCHLKKEDPSLFAKSFVSAKIKTNQVRKYAVPTSAIVKYNQKPYVFILAPSKQCFQMEEVTIGVSDEDFTAIINYQQLKNKEIVISKTFELLSSIANTSDE